MFCNFWQLPNLGFLVPQGGDPLSALHPRRRLLLGAYALGIVAFALGLGPLTGPAAYGAFEERWPHAAVLPIPFPVSGL